MEGGRLGPQSTIKRLVSLGWGGGECRQNSGEWFLTLEGRQKYLV